MTSSPKTLVIRFSSIGDIVLSTPLLRVLRNRFPLAQIDYLTKKEYAELVRYNHNLNYTYEFDSGEGFDGLRRLKSKIRSERYDLIIDIHNSIRSRYLRSVRGATIVTIDKRIVQRTALVKLKKNLYTGVVSVADRYIEPLRRFDVLNDGKGPELHVPDEILFGTSGKIAGLQLNQFEKVIGFCPGARHRTKCWPQERYVELGIHLTKQFNAKILLFGGNEDRPVCNAIGNDIRLQCGEKSVTDFSGALTLLETATTMEFCDAVVTNDTGLMHIANAMHGKLVVVFGSTVKEFGFFPFGEDAVVLERSGLYCRPCSHIGRDECPEGHFRCMREIEVDEVLRSTTAMLMKE